MTSDVPPQTPPTEASLAASDLGGAPRSLLSTDQKVFVGVALAGLLITASVTTISIVHRRQEAAQAKEILTPAATKLLQTPQRTLTDRTGRTVTRADFDGKFLVVNFVFTGCSLSCLAVNHRMAEIQRSVAAHDDVRLVSLTVDPDSDTPERLAKFAAQFGANTNRSLFLTGEKRVLHPLLEKKFSHAFGSWESSRRMTLPEHLLLRRRVYFQGRRSCSRARCPHCLASKPR